MKSIWKLRLGILATIALVAGTVGFVGGGYAFAASGDVSGNVFDDVDSNGANNGEAGLANVTVTAYDAAGNTAGSATTDGSGDYTISGLSDGEQYRIEFTNLPTEYVDGPAGADSQSSVTFATPETTGVDFGAIVPEECAQPPAGALLNTYAAAVSCSAVVDPAYPKDSFGLIDIDATVPASGRVNQSGSTPMFHHPDWHIDRIGNVFGTAVDNTRGDMFAAASSNYSHAFYTNTGVGVRPAIVQYGAIGGGANDLGAAGTLYKMDAMTGAPSVFVQLPQQSTTVTHRDCERNTTLNRTTGVGLGNVVYDETNDQLFVSNWEDGHIYRIAMDGTILDAYDPDATDDGSPGMANGRVPFALETANDGSRLYFGTVLGREVWSIDLTPTGGFTGGSSLIGGVTIHANSSSETLNQTISVTGGEPSPGWLNGNLMFFVSDLEILPAGQMLAGLRVGCSNSPHGAYNHQGQTHRLTANGAGLFTGDNGALNISATGDAGLDDNYGGVDFFNNPTTGTTQFAVTSADILAEAGPHGLAVFANSSAGGGQKSPLGAIDYGTDNDPKGIAGDVSVLNLQVCTPSPVQIGNRVWLDLDNNGVQDPGEAALVDVTVTLFASDGSTVLDTTTTDGNGEYAFGESSGVMPNTNYVLGFDPLTSSTSLPAGFTLADLFATAVDVGAASNPDLTDSDMVGTTISVTTGGAGENDHSYDAGFTLPYDLALTQVYTSDTFGNTSDGVVENGEDVTFTITVTNQGHAPASSFEVTDYLPSGFTLNDAAWTDNGDGTATFNAGALSSGSSVDIPLTLTADSAGAGDLVNWAEISVDDGNDIDSTPDTDQANDSQPAAVGDPTDDVIDNSGGDEDDHDPAGVTVIAYDLALTKVYTSDTFGDPSDGVVENGADVTFTITVTNQGTVTANSFEVTDYLPSGFTLNDAAWTDNGDGTATFNAGPLAVGASVDLTITLRSDSATNGVKENWAEISVDDGNDADSSPDSNQANDNQPAAPGDPTDGVIDNSGGDQDDHDVAGVSVASYDLALMQVYTSDTYGDPTDGVVDFASEVTFTITVTNQGTVDAASVELVDYIPAGLTLDDAAWADNGDGTATYSAGALLAGESIDVPITFTVSTQTAGEIVNWAEISVDDGNDADSSPDSNRGNDNQPVAPGDPTDDVIDNSGGDEDDHDPAGVAVEIFDLALTKAYTSDTFGNPTDGVIESGANVLFTITVTNQGTIDATTFDVTDHLPAGFSLNDAAWTDNGDGTATFTAGVLLAGSSVDIPVTLRADAVSPGTYVNWAELSSDDGTDVDSTPDSDPSNDNQPSSPGDPTDGVIDNSNGDEDDHDPAAVGVANYDLALIKSYTSDTFGAPTDGVLEDGADVTFTITVTNQGTIDASSFEVTDYLPAGFDLNDAAWTDNGDGTATFSAGSLPGGASVQIPVTLTANGATAGDQVNRAEISVDDGNDIDSTPDADQVNDNQPVAPGDPTDDVTDNTNGDEDDHDIAGFSVVAYDLALSQVYTSDTFGDPSDGVIENGTDVTFTITVHNQGMIDATNFSVTNYIPTGFVLNDAAWTDNGDGTATITTGPLPSGASVDIPVTLTANSAAAGALVNWAEISADDGNDIDSTPNTDQGDDNQPAAPGDPTDDVIDNSNGDEDDHDPAGVTVAEYDLALRKVYTSDTFGDPTDGRVEIGSDVTFTITVFNQGDLDATAITITDYLPAGFVLNDAAWTDNGNRTANRAGFGPIAAGDSLTTTITMTATTANTGEAKNVAEISQDDGNDVDSNPDGGVANDNQPTDPGDPTDDVVDNTDGDEDDHDIAGVVVDRYDLALITTFASDTFGDPTDGVIEPNTDVTFEVTLTNQGTIDATDVEVTAYLPTGFVLNDPAWTDNGDGTATTTGIGLAAGDGDPVTIPITTTGVGVTTGTYVLWAEISVDDGNDVDSTPDTDQANDNQPSSPGDPTDDVVDNTDGDEDDHDPAAVGVENYDLALIKSLSDDGFGDPNDGLTEDGADVTFMITVINQGTLDAASFEVTDYLPVGFVLDDAAWTDNGDGTVSFSAGALSSGASVDIPLRVTLTGVADGDYVNVAEISADDGNDIDSTTDADATNDNQPANPGDPTDDATNNALDGAGDPDEDDHDLAGLTVGSFDLALVKTYTSDTSTDGNATDGRVQPGDDVTFTITVINQGDLDAASFEITDHLPTGFVLNDAAWSNGAAGTATITGGPLAASESVDITITMTATGRIAGDVVNMAEISSDAGNDVDSTPNGDPDDDDQPAEPGDPTDDVVDNTDGDEDDHDIAGLTLDVYDLELEKDFVSDTSADGNATDGRIQIGDDATFTIRVVNTGTVDAASLEVTDYLPVGFELNDPAWSDNGDGTASITRGALPAGGSDSIPITITSVSNGAGEHVNWAEISTDDGDDIDSTPNDDPDDDGDPPTEDDIDEAPLTVEAYDLALRKVRTSDTSADGNATDGLIEVGDDVTFTITVFNQGTADATTVEVTDYLPNGFTVSDATWTDNGDGTATTTTGALAAGASRDLTFTMTATSANVGDHLNGAEISADDGVDVDSVPNSDPSDDGTVTDDEIDNNNGDEDDHDTAPVRVVPPSELAPVTLALGNVVWFDDDFDGIFDADEDPVAGVTLVLFDGTGQPILGTDGEPRSVVTASDGTYLFDGLAEGTYIVAVVGSNFAPGGPLADVVTTVGNDVAAGLAPDPDDDVDEDDNGSFVLGGGAVSQPIVLAIGLEPDGNVNLTVDFGFIPAAGLGSLVWFDNDRDGAQDSSEAGVPDVEVTVTHVASGRVFGRDTTDATGNWSVTGLPPGDYTVTFDDPENRAYTSIDRGDDALDSDAQPDGTTGVVELSAGEYDPTIDAGILPPQPTPPTIAFTGSAWAMALLAWAIGLGFVGWALLLMSRDPEENPYLS